MVYESKTGPSENPTMLIEGPANNDNIIDSKDIVRLGDYKFNLQKEAVLNFVKEHYDCCIGEIALNCGLDYQDTKKILAVLEYEGHIRILMRTHFFPDTPRRPSQ